MPTFLHGQYLETERMCHFSASVLKRGFSSTSSGHTLTQHTSAVNQVDMNEDYVKLYLKIGHYWLNGMVLKKAQYQFWCMCHP